MSATPRINLVGFYNFDDTLFDGIGEIDGIDRSELVNSILLSYGEMPVLYTNLPFMKSMIGVWWNKWLPSFIRIQEAISAEYNPIHNYDRYEEYEDTEKGAAYDENAVYVTGNSELQRDGENLVSAYNASDYQADTKQVGIDRNAAHQTTTGTDSLQNERELKHKAHLYGNIGVTTSGQMQLETMDIYKNNNIYDIIGGIFAEEFLLKIY